MMTKRSVRCIATLYCFILLSCGPKIKTSADIERIKKEYCETAARCSEDPEVDVMYCVERLDELGVRDGGWYDDSGCLESEGEYLSCLAELTCDDFLQGVDSEQGGQCNAELMAMYEQGCPPGTG